MSPAARRSARAIPTTSSASIAKSSASNRSIARAKRRGPSLTFDVELNPLYMVGEPDSLERAITNLLDNAVKFSPPGGTIRVLLEGDRLRISDQGPGIAPEERDLVFERFFRSDSARSMPGSGLGLAIVKQVVLKHGGTIDISDTVPGGDPPGTSIRMVLPGSPAPGAPVAGDTAGEPPNVTVGSQQG